MLFSSRISYAFGPGWQSMIALSRGIAPSARSGAVLRATQGHEFGLHKPIVRLGRDWPVNRQLRSQAHKSPGFSWHTCQSCSCISSAMLFCSPCARVMLVAQGLDPTIFPQCSRLTANLASAEGLVCGDSDALANGFIPTTVHIEAQTAKFLLHLQYFKLASACSSLEFSYQWLQVLAQPPQDVEPAVVVREALWHQGVPYVAPC